MLRSSINNLLHTQNSDIILDYKMSVFLEGVCVGERERERERERANLCSQALHKTNIHNYTSIAKPSLEHNTHTSSHRKPATSKSQCKHIATPKPKIQPFEHPKLETKILSFLTPPNPNQNPFFFQIIKLQKENQIPKPVNRP